MIHKRRLYFVAKLRGTESVLVDNCLLERPDTAHATQIYTLVGDFLLVTLKAVASIFLIFITRMAQHVLPSRLRIHRNKSGLSQRELAYILGYRREVQIIRHEQATSMPSFLTALAYEAVFRVPVSELFPGFAETVAYGIEKRLGELERTLQEKNSKGRNARAIARKLEWMCARRNGIEL